MCIILRIYIILFSHKGTNMGYNEHKQVKMFDNLLGKKSEEMRHYNMYILVLILNALLVVFVTIIGRLLNSNVFWRKKKHNNVTFHIIWKKCNEIVQAVNARLKFIFAEILLLSFIIWDVWDLSYFEHGTHNGRYFFAFIDTNRNIQTYQNQSTLFWDKYNLESSFYLVDHAVTIDHLFKLLHDKLW